MDHCVPKINCKHASLCMAPRSSGIQYLPKHEFNLPLAGSWVLYMYAFYCTPPGQECQFSQRRKPVRTLHPIKNSQHTTVWFALSVIRNAAGCCGRGDFNLSHFTGTRRWLFLLFLSHIYWPLVCIHLCKYRCTSISFCSYI